MRICIIDQCSAAKRVPSGFEPLQKSEIHGIDPNKIVNQSDLPTLPASDLYDGRQQRYITQAVDKLRRGGDTVTRRFISAGFGVVDESTELPPYDVTFGGLSTQEIKNRADKLGIHDGIRDELRVDPPYDIVFFALGKDYYEAFNLDVILDAVSPKTAVTVFNQPELATRGENVISIPAGNTQSKEVGTIVVALKGWYIRNFAEHRYHRGEVETIEDIRTYCITELTTQTGLDKYERE